MSRDRHQAGWVEETGKLKKWKGHYYVYVQQPDGTEKRSHRAVILGLKSKLKKWEAQQALQAIIDRETSNAVLAPSPQRTLRWFWTERYLPMKQGKWKSSSKPKTIRFVENYVLNLDAKRGKMGEWLLGDLDRFSLQMAMNGLAEKYSKSVTQKFYVYIRSILDEAVEQNYLSKNPASGLDLPETRKEVNRALAEDEVLALLAVLSGRDRLIVRMFLVLGLRAGELFALRRDDRIYPSQLRIDEGASAELPSAANITTPKTRQSKAYVWLPRSIDRELDWWLGTMEDKRPDALLFPSEAGTPLAANNYMARVVKPAAMRARQRLLSEGHVVPKGFLEGINFQAFRRTCATQMQDVGNVKDAQAHLRHASPAMTVGVYMQEIPASVRAAVESLDAKLEGGREIPNPIVN